MKPSKAAIKLANAILDVMLPEPFRTETAAIPGTIEDMAAQVQAALSDLLDKAQAVVDANYPQHLYSVEGRLFTAIEPWKPEK